MLKKNNFNSIKVRLERGKKENAVNCLCYFNSIKVRLEQKEGNLTDAKTQISIP